MIRNLTLALILILPVMLFSNELAGELFLGNLKTHNKITKILDVENNNKVDLHITFYSLCDCLEVSPISKTIKPGNIFSFKISLLPEGYGYISRHILVDQNGLKSTIRVYANLPEAPEKPLTGGCPLCEVKEKEIQEEETARNILENWIISDIYYSPGCKTCEDFIGNLDENISLNRHNILEPDELVVLENRLRDLNISLTSFPILITGKKVLQGEDVNITEFTELLNSKNTDRLNTPYIESIEYLKPLPIFLAGLIDGINPCAFTTLLFLISSLFYIGRGKKEILQTGIIFSVTIFLSYYLVGLGMLNIVRAANFFPIVSSVIKYVLITALLVLGLLSLYDAYLVKKGKLKSLKLQLPESLKKRIHSVIRTNTRKRGLIAGTVIIGIMVTVFELACTGQVYLPIIAYIIKIEGSLSSYFYLTLYNLGFITPLLALFITIYRGTTNQKIVIWFQKRIFLIKILLALFFFSMILFL